MRAMTGRLGTGLCTLVFLLAAGCGAADVIANNTDSPSPSGGVASLQTAPYNDAGQPTHAPPVQIPPPAALGGEVLDFTSIAANFDPNIQRFVWVLPPGVHGEAPWGFTAQVRHKGEVKYEAELPLVAQMVAAGSRPEYTAGYEIIRLTDDGRWSERTAAMDKVILADRAAWTWRWRSRVQQQAEPVARCGREAGLLHRGQDRRYPPLCRGRRQGRDHPHAGRGAGRLQPDGRAARLRGLIVPPN
jgi:hypothetical protein